MPVPAVAIVAPVAGVVLVTGIVLRARALSKKREAETAATNARAAALPPLPAAAQAVLQTRGPEPDQATINTLKFMQEAGQLDVANLLKGTDGSVFTKVSPPGAVGISDDLAVQMFPDDQMTVDVAAAGIRIAAIPSGNMLFKVMSKPDMSSRTVVGIPIDPRVPDGEAAIKIPLAAVTGFSPGND